jgi:ubiquinone/menaquinone biosynthesis C-methylase UbiE
MMNPEEFDNLARFEREFWWHRGMEQILYRVLDPLTRGRRLHLATEAGCGTGYMSSRLQQHYGWRIFPTDLGREGILYGTRSGFNHAMTQADLAALPFRSEQFDVVAGLDVIAHFRRGDEHLAIREMVRVLAPGGLLVIRTSALDVLRSHHSKFTHERQRFTRGRLMNAVSKEGIRILRCTYANSLLLPVAFTKFRILEPLSRSRPSSGIQPVAPWLNRLLYGLLRTEAAWLGSGRDLPLGQSLLLIGERNV